ncbi:hypothetical protein X559_2026 [Paenilisteria newyorkensis]|nr:hypothetical protein X559_2026 [Listeria newyorkensis]
MPLESVWVSFFDQFSTVSLNCRDKILTKKEQNDEKADVKDFDVGLWFNASRWLQ